MREREGLEILTPVKTPTEKKELESIGGVRDALQKLKGSRGG